MEIEIATSGNLLSIQSTSIRPISLECISPLLGLLHKPSIPQNFAKQSCQQKNHNTYRNTSKNDPTCPSMRLIFHIGRTWSVGSKIGAWCKTGNCGGCGGGCSDLSFNHGWNEGEISRIVVEVEMRFHSRIRGWCRCIMFRRGCCGWDKLSCNQ
jgi:hypothetical protein